MTRKVSFILLLGIVLTGLSSCKMISSFLHNDELVAKVGDYRLSLVEVKRLVPPGTSTQDSLILTQNYINNWVDEHVYLQIAEQQLSEEELDVSRELEEYRRSLLKYRYEQRYINERLDTAVSEDQIEAYYAQHKENFRLKLPIVKARFLKISADSPYLEPLKEKILSTDMEKLADLDSLANASADRYTDYSGKWVDIITLSREFGEDYGTLLGKLNKSVIETEDVYGKLNVAHILEFKKVGEIPPVEYCSESIKDIILSARRQELMVTLERDLLNEARESQTLVIY